MKLGTLNKTANYCNYYGSFATFHIVNIVQ